ncbi:MAG: flagellar export chaperone FliS [Deltaproteobacteria bacterium]|nr:flagellar export chaperone FliS [Deltaproteobacteria bacterium]
MGYNMSNNYKKTSIETAGKLDLVIMCYEKAIQLLMQAKNHFEMNEIEKKARKMQKALDILNELQSCLNMEKGGQIAKNLDAIYAYLTRRLLLGDIKKDLDAFNESIRILSELKEAWDEIAHGGDDHIGVTESPKYKGIDGARIAA